jgi:hypothetical protein
MKAGNYTIHGISRRGMCLLFLSVLNLTAYELDFSTYKSADEDVTASDMLSSPEEVTPTTWDYDLEQFERTRERYKEFKEEMTSSPFPQEFPQQFASDELKFRKEDPLFSQPDKDKALYNALALQDVSALKEALAAGANPNTPIYYNETPTLAAYKAWQKSGFMWPDGLIELVQAGARIEGTIENTITQEFLNTLSDDVDFESFKGSTQHNRWNFLKELISASKATDVAERFAGIEQALSYLSLSLTPEQRAQQDVQQKFKTPAEESDDLYRWEYLEVDTDRNDSWWKSLKKQLGIKSKNKNVLIPAPEEKSDQQDLEDWEILFPTHDAQGNLDEELSEELKEWEEL